MKSIVHLFQLLSADEAILVSIEDLESLPNCVCIVVLQQMQQGISQGRLAKVVSEKEAERGEQLIGEDKITVKVSAPPWPSASSIPGTLEIQSCRCRRGRPQGSCWAARLLSGSAPSPSSRPAALCERWLRFHPVRQFLREVQVGGNKHVDIFPPYKPYEPSWKGHLQNSFLRRGVKSEEPVLICDA